MRALLRVDQRVDDAEMVQPRQSLGQGHALAPPGLANQALLAQVLAAFVAAGHALEDSRAISRLYDT